VGPILYRLGRLLQLVGMLMLPLAIAGNLAPTDPMPLKTSLMLSGAGVCVFIVGYLLQNAGRPS
jgi:drug/metabolite transporter (DMT)-like permease